MNAIAELVRGSGGGGGGSQSAPTVASDTLFSYDTGFILDAISEGQIEGLVNGLQSVFLDNTPVQNANGSYNFLNLTVWQAHGTQHQGYMPIESDVESTTPVAVKITQASPVVRTITDPNIDAVRVTLSTPGLNYQDSNGNVSGTSVSFTIEIQTNGGGFVNVMTDAFSGKASSKYDRAYRFPLSGTGPWDIRVSRLTADSTLQTLNNDLWVDSLTEITDTKLSYPNTALIGMLVDARSFQSIPKRSYHIKGMLVQVPSNYDPVTRTYTGLWDGTFKTAWTNNPAWCYYDMVTSTRYGLGNYIAASQIDKWELYAIGQYCDGMVPDGYGGMEPRFTLNIYMMTAAEAFQVIDHLASVFRGMTYWGAGMITAVQDAPSDPVALFTQANVINGEFNYSGASRKVMHTVALVTWNDPTNQYKQATAYVSDDEAIKTYGVISTPVVAYGTTSRGQAHRVGRWLLETEKNAKTVVFGAALDSTFIRSGKILAILDAHKAGKRNGGRLLSSGSTASSLALDAEITIETGKTYSVSVVLPDGTIGTAAITNAPGSTSTLTLGSALAEVPQPNAIWVIAASDLAPTTWKCLSISEAAKNQYQITAMVHDPNKFLKIEQGIVFQPNKTTSIPTQPNAPANIVIKESLRVVSGLVRSVVTVSWDKAPGDSFWRAAWRNVPGNFITLPDTTTNSVDIIDVPPGAFEISVYALNSLGVSGPAASDTAQVLGKTAPPSDVSNFWVTRSGDNLYFTWPDVTDLDLDHYEIRLGATWDTAQLVTTSVRNAATILSAQGGTFQIKAVDTTGNYSINAAQDIVAANNTINVVLTDDDAASGWPGTLTNMVKDGATLTLSYADPWALLTNPWNSYTDSWMSDSVPLASGNYVTDVNDIGSILNCRLSVAPSIDSIPLGATWDMMGLPWASYGSNYTWEGPVGAITATYEINTSTDNILWSGWQPFMPGMITLRYYQMRATFTAQAGYQVRLNNMPITVDVPDRTDKFSNLAVSAAGLTQVFTTPFTQAQRAFVTIKGGAAGDSYAISLNNNSFTLTIYNAALAAKAGVADVEISGY